MFGVSLMHKLLCLRVKDTDIVDILSWMIGHCPAWNSCHSIEAILIVKKNMYPANIIYHQKKVSDILKETTIYRQ